MVEEEADEAQVAYIWQPPVARDPALPLVEQVRQGPRCAGDVAIRVESDGTIIPPRGPRQAAGNLLTQSWEAIWNHPAFRQYRERVEAPTRCQLCPGMAICAADCPVEPRGWATN
jgi:radical SAM protein with 4Fe4S-binding SPASM domain